MKSILVIVSVLTILANPSLSQTTGILPAPLHVETLSGEFVFTSSTIIIAPESLAIQADIFSATVMDLLGRKLFCSSSGKSNGNILLIIDKNLENQEAYELHILPGYIELKASAEAGIFYGLPSSGRSMALWLPRCTQTQSQFVQTPETIFL